MQTFIKLIGNIVVSKIESLEMKMNFHDVFFYRFQFLSKVFYSAQDI